MRSTITFVNANLPGKPVSPPFRRLNCHGPANPAGFSSKSKSASALEALTLLWPPICKGHPGYSNSQHNSTKNATAAAVQSIVVRLLFINSITNTDQISQGLQNAKPHLQKKV